MLPLKKLAIFKAKYFFSAMEFCLDLEELHALPNPFVK